MRPSVFGFAVVLVLAALCATGAEAKSHTNVVFLGATGDLVRERGRVWLCVSLGRARLTKGHGNPPSGKEVPLAGLL